MCCKSLYVLHSQYLAASIKGVTRVCDVMLKCESLILRNQWKFPWNVSRVYLTRAPARRSCSMRSLETNIEDCLQNHERSKMNVCKIIATSGQSEHLVTTSGGNVQWSIAVVVDDVRVRSGPQDHRQGVLLWTTLIFFLLLLLWTIIVFSSCRFTTLLVLLWTPCSCQRQRYGPRCCPPRLERLLLHPGIVYNCAWKKMLNLFFFFQ